MALTLRENELIAVGISVAAGCRPCTTYHLGEARRGGATDAEIEKAVAGAVCVRTNATEAMRRHGLGLDPAPGGCGCEKTDALAELVALGASLVVNCTDSIDRHLAAARSLGVPQEHIDAVVAQVGKVRAKAVAHAEARLGGEAAQRPIACCGGGPAEAEATGCC